MTEFKGDFMGALSRAGRSADTKVKGKYFALWHDNVDWPHGLVSGTRDEDDDDGEVVDPRRGTRI